MTDFIIKNSEGKPVFIGQEDPHNPPVAPSGGNKMVCPICQQEFNYLLGEDTPDGGRMGCETCWKPSLKGGKHENTEIKDVFSE